MLQGDDAVVRVGHEIRRLAAEFEIAELVHDPWRAQQLALELEADGMTVVAFPQSDARMVQASEALYAAVVEGRLTHPDDPELNRHIAQCVARQTPRGPRLDKRKSRDQIDAAVALAMAIDRAAQPAEPEPVLLGWL